MNQVCLVSMPYELLHYPNIGVSVLSAGLRKAGIPTRVRCSKFQFAEDVGLLYYVGIAASPATFLMGEWTFSHLLFPSHESDYDEFLKEKIETCPGLFAEFRGVVGGDQDILTILREIREKSRAFIDRTVREILTQNPRIVGCSSTFQQHCASLVLLKKIKELEPSIITLMGGSNCEGPMGIANKRLFPWVDFVISGEADNVFPELCQSLLDNGADISPEDLPRNVYSAAHVAAPPFDNPAVTPVVPLPAMDEAATPDYSDYFNQLDKFEYRDRIYPWLLMETSRGCWWAAADGGCTFCGLNGKLGSYRCKSAARVLAELRFLSEQYNIKDFFFTDTILEMSYFKTVLPKLAEENPPKYNLIYEVKSNLKEHHVEMLAAAGMKAVQPGIEHLDDTVLKLMNKGVTAIQNLALLKYGMEQGVTIIWNFLWGFPGEEDAWYEEMAAWLPLVFHLRPPNQFLPLLFARFSAYHNDPDRYNLELAPAPVYSHLYPFDEENLQSLAYYFEPTVNDCKTKFDSPGILKLQVRVKEWRRLFAQKYKSGNEFPLTLKESGDRLIITDKRPIAVEEEIVLEGLERMIYQACATPVKADALFGRMTSEKEESGSREAFDRALDELKNKKILLGINGSLLSLALRRQGKQILKDGEIMPGYNLEGLKPQKKNQVFFWEAS